MDAATVRHLARLARLELDAAEVERTARDLTALLHDIEALRELAAESSLESEGVVQEVTTIAPDAPDPLHMPVSYIAPEWCEGFFAVPPSATGRDAGADA